MPEQNIHIQINLNGLRARLSRSLQKTMLLVAAGLQNIEKLDPDNLELPAAITHRIESGLKWNKEVAHDVYEEWVLCNGFRDSIESLGYVLEDAHRVLTIWDLLGNHGPQIKIAGAEWNRVVVSGERKFHRLGLPDKITHLREMHNLGVDPVLGAHVLSINIARNCLVHREGIVSKRDLNDSANMMVTWRRLSIFLKSEDGEKPLALGERVEKESEVCIRHDDVAKAFALGQPVRFSTQEFAEVCWALWLFGEDLVGKINAVGLQRGFLNETS